MSYPLNYENSRRYRGPPFNHRFRSDSFKATADELLEAYYKLRISEQTKYVEVCGWNLGPCTMVQMVINDRIVSITYQLLGISGGSIRSRAVRSKETVPTAGLVLLSEFQQTLIVPGFRSTKHGLSKGGSLWAVIGGAEKARGWIRILALGMIARYGQPET